MASINIDQLANEVMKDLRIYQLNTLEDVERAVRETAEETVLELNRTSPQGQTGKYRKSWAIKRDPGIPGKWRMSLVVYAKKPDYRLTHLLEFGYAKVSGGRVKALPHIRRAEDNALTRLFDKLTNRLRYTD